MGFIHYNCFSKLSEISLSLCLSLSLSQIKALVSCGKLKSAYLIAVKSKLVDEVRNISEIAGKAGQLPVRDICEKWLQANAV